MNKITPFPISEDANAQSMLQLVAAKDPDMAIVIFETEADGLQCIFRTKDGSDRSTHETMGLLNAAALSFYEDTYPVI